MLQGTYYRMVMDQALAKQGADAQSKDAAKPTRRRRKSSQRASVSVTSFGGKADEEEDDELPLLSNTPSPKVSRRCQVICCSVVIEGSCKIQAPWEHAWSLVLPQGFFMLSLIGLYSL